MYIFVMNCILKVTLSPTLVLNVVLSQLDVKYVSSVHVFTFNNQER